MRAGRAEHTLVIQRRQQTQADPAGQFGTPLDTWTDLYEVPGCFEVLGSREFPAAQKRYAETTARFRIRYIAGINAATDRIVMVFDPGASPIITSTWDIAPPIPVKGKRFELLIEAFEVV